MGVFKEREMYIPIGAIVFIIMLAIMWYNFKRENGEIFKRRYKPKQKLPQECMRYFSQCECVISTIANLRNYELILDCAEKQLREDFGWFNAKKIGKPKRDCWDEYWSEMFENITDAKCRIWAVHFVCCYFQSPGNRMLMRDSEKMLYNSLANEYDNWEKANDIPGRFKIAWSI